MTVDVWWQQFSVQALGGAAGTLLVSALLSALSPTVREKFWKPIGRALRWLTTLRLTTTGRVAAERAAAEEKILEQARQYEQFRDAAEKSAETAQVRIASLQDQAEAAREAGFEAGRAVAAGELKAAKDEAAAEKAEAARVRGVAADAANKLQGDLDMAEARAKQQALDQAAANQKLVEYTRELGREEGRAEAEAEVAAQRAALTVRPVWRVVYLDDPWTPDAFELRNVQPGTGQLSDVRLESHMNTFLFNGPSQWPGPWTAPVKFRGERAGAGRSFEVEFDVHYRDANGDWKRGMATLARPAVKPPPGGMVAKRDADDPLGPLPKHF